MQSLRSLPLFFIPEFTFWKLTSVVKWRQIPFITCKSQIFVLDTLRTATAETSWENSSLRYIYLSMHIYIYSSPFHLATAHHFIILQQLNPFDLSVDREGSWFEHYVIWLRVYYQQTALKIFPGPNYPHAEDGVLWLWD